VRASSRPPIERCRSIAGPVSQNSTANVFSRRGRR
jgi:hypothetical protein